MDNNSKILDDLTRVAGGAFTILSTLGKQIQNNVKDQMGSQGSPKFSFSAPANDDVERLQGMVSKMRIEQEELKKRVTYLEGLLGKKANTATKAKTAAKAKAKPKTKPKKSSAKK